MLAPGSPRPEPRGSSRDPRTTRRRPPPTPRRARNERTPDVEHARAPRAVHSARGAHLSAAGAGFGEANPSPVASRRRGGPWVLLVSASEGADIRRRHGRGLRHIGVERAPKLLLLWSKPRRPVPPRSNRARPRGSIASCLSPFVPLAISPNCLSRDSTEGEPNRLGVLTRVLADVPLLVDPLGRVGNLSACRKSAARARCSCPWVGERFGSRRILKRVMEPSAFIA